MNSSSVTSGNWRFAPDILRRLGEELIPNPEQGLIELIKNAYDADASTCSLLLSQVSKPGGTIIIEDDGDGMDEEDLLNGFLLIGKSRKSPARRTNGLGRLPAGDKGLGRIAALRLGKRVIVRSRPKQNPGVELRLDIDWDIIDGAASIESVNLDIVSALTSQKHGVTIEISGLKSSFDQKKAKSLARELLLLSDPFHPENGFRAVLTSPEFLELEERVRNGYLLDSQFLLTAYIGESGVGEATLNDAFGNQIAHTALPLDEQKIYNIPQCTFQLWIYILNGANFTAKALRVRDVGDWLKTVGGVHIYHRGLRVRPYGDSGTDWLGMNVARAQHADFRPSTNTVIGRVEVEDPRLLLEQPTDRIGFVENEAFQELRRFARDVVEWSSKIRLVEANKRRQEEKKALPQESVHSPAEFLQVIQKVVPPEKRELVKAEFIKYDEKNTRNEKLVLSLKEDLQLYRSVATAGTTSVVFAHESAKPISFIKNYADTIERRGKEYLGKRYAAQFGGIVDSLRHISASLSAFTQFPIFHLKKSKRRMESVDVSNVWKNIEDLFKPLLRDAKIDITLDFDTEKIPVLASVALIEAIATNLITNSVHVFIKEGAQLDNRQILITGRVELPWIVITHSDSGPGIRGINMDEIWIAGQSTNKEGTGFGLTIVRDTIDDLRGEISAKANGELGGAEFKILLPVKIDNTPQGDTP